MATDLIHTKATSSWWRGTVTALCGATWPKEQTERVWFSSPTCPTCKRLKKNGEQAKRGGRK